MNIRPVRSFHSVVAEPPARRTTTSGPRARNMPPSTIQLRPIYKTSLRTLPVMDSKSPSHTIKIESTSYNRSEVRIVKGIIFFQNRPVGLTAEWETLTHRHPELAIGNTSETVTFTINP